MLENYMLAGIPPWIFWICVSLAIIVQGISKSGFGGGVAILSTPLMMLVMPVDLVVASLLPLLVLLDLNAIYHHRHNKVWKTILKIYIPAVIGILGGVAFWWWIGNEGLEAYSVPVKRFVGMIAISFSIYILAKDRAVDWATRVKLGRRSAWILGTFSGFTSAMAHVAGPPVALYMFSQGMGKSLFVGTTAWTFMLINLTKLPLYVGIGLIGPRVLYFDLFLLWLIPIGSWLGKWLHDRVSERLFNRIIMVLVMIAGIQLATNINFVLMAINSLMSS